MKVALYARVSKEMQNPKMQEIALIKKAKLEGWDYDLFVERESSRKARPVKYNLYNRLLKKEYGAVIVWRLDRWARSVQEASKEIETLFNKGIPFISLTEHIDLTSASGRLQFNVITAFAQFERDIISDRTKEGLKHAKNVGKRGKDKGPRKKSGYYRRWAKTPNS